MCRVDGWFDVVDLSEGFFAFEKIDKISGGHAGLALNGRVSEALRIFREAPASMESIEQIAKALGYKDIYFFSRQFKQLVGKSPRQYRKGVQ